MKEEKSSGKPRSCSCGDIGNSGGSLFQSREGQQSSSPGGRSSPLEMPDRQNDVSGQDNLRKTLDDNLSRIYQYHKQFSKAITNWKKEKLEKGSRPPFEKKYATVYSAEKNYFYQIQQSCDELKLMAYAGKLKYTTVAAIFEEIDQTLRTMFDAETEELEKNDENHTSNGYTHYLDTKNIPYDKIEKKSLYFQTKKTNRVEYVINMVQKMQDNCSKHIAQDGWESRHTPKIIKGLKVAGVILTTVAAAVAGMGIMFLLGNYGQEVFAEKIADAITSQIGVFASAGAAASVGGFFAGKRLCFGMGNHAKAGKLTDKLGNSLKTLVRAKANYDMPHGDDTRVNILQELLFGDVPMQNGRMIKVPEYATSYRPGSKNL